MGYSEIRSCDRVDRKLRSKGKIEGRAESMYEFQDGIVVRFGKKKDTR